MLRHFLFGELDGDLLLLSLAQNRERYIGAFRKGLEELSQLAGLDQNLIVQHLENVVLLNCGLGGWTIGHHIIDHQPKTFGQAKLFAHNTWNWRCLDAEKRHRNFRRSFMATRRCWHTGRGRRRWRRGWRLRKSCNRQESDGCNSSDRFYFHGFIWLNH